MKHAIFRPLLGSAAATFLLAASVLAQQPPDKSNAPDQNSPSQFDAQAGKPEPQNKTLSQRLSETNGVIKPPGNVDPDIHETPPPTGDRNIIPPPNAPAVQPK
ncbi:MAG: hypothetical protein ACXWKC_01375 [Xanthobacteraceae bacterium]